METAQKTRFTEYEYLALEQASRTRHEFVDGQIVAMAGGSPRHSLIALNVAAVLRAALRDRPCVVLGSDLAVHIAAAGAYVYPDVTVVCGEVELGPKRPAGVRNPVLVVEVLSRSTRGYDLGDKFDLFRRLPSLVDFLAVRQHERLVQHFHRTDVGRWLVVEVEGDGVVELGAMGIALPLREIYEKIELFPEEEE